jgi:hypothetical protein
MYHAWQTIIEPFLIVDLWECVSHALADRLDTADSCVPMAESNAILAFLYSQIAENYDFQIPYKWEPNDVAIWDNRISGVPSFPPPPPLLLLLI